MYAKSDTLTYFTPLIAPVQTWRPIRALSPSSDVDPFGADKLKREDCQRLAVERMRMKRFSSALCLADRQQQRQQADAGKEVQQQQQQVAGSAKAKVALISVEQPTQQQRKSSGKVPIAKIKTPDEAIARDNDDKLHLAPDDPMILARQRRPSVSKGSVNVDQQGE